MRSLRAWMVRLGGVFTGERRDRDFDVELESHLQLHIDDGLRRGLSAAEARRQAVLKIGGLERTREQHRDRRGLPALETLLRDLRYAVRVLRQRPGYSMAAIVVLALGIGANTAIFSVVHAVLLRPLPFPDADRLTFVWHTPPPDAFPGMTRFAVSPANFLDWQRQARSFERMGLMAFRPFNITGGGEPESLSGAGVTAGFFQTLGAQPLLGRTLRPDEDAPGHNHVAVLSERLWTRRFGADPGVVGRKVTLNGEPFTVVGVMPSSFHVPNGAALWTPVAWSAEDAALRNNHMCIVVARLKPGVDMVAAQAEMTGISRRLEQAYPEDDKGWGAVIIPLHEGLVEDIKPALLVLLGAVAFVLLIACANVANLVLARTMGRRKEIGLRLALGASGARVLRQVLCETAVLGLLGGAAGLLVAQAAVQLIVAYLGKTLPDEVAIRLDVPVLGFTLAASLLCGILSGIGAAWRLTRTNVSDALKQGLSRTDADAGGHRTRTVLVVAEVALSLMLLVGAGLMIRSLYYLQSLDTGMDAGNVLTGEVILPGTRYPTPEKQSLFYAEVLDRVRALPGVETVGLTSGIPLDNASGHWPISIEGRPAPLKSQQPMVVGMVISPGFLKAFRIGLVSGRDITGSDIKGRPPVILISESMARHFWPNESPLGARVRTIFIPDQTFEVVGVVNDVKLDGLDVSTPVQAMYLPFHQAPNGFMSIVVRTSSAPATLSGSLIRAIHEIDPDQPVMNVRTMDEVSSGSIERRRFTMLLLAGFAGLALLLASVGIYSVLAYAVRQRVREIGIRLALGAQPSEVLRLMLMSGLRPTVLGIAIGLAGAAAIVRTLTSFFVGISGTDPLTFAAVSSLVLVVGLSASLIPAWRATTIDPIRTLRDE